MAWIEKQRNIIDFALSSLFRKWGKNLALLVVYTVIVFILASIFFFTGSIKKEASLILQASPEIVVQRIVAGRHDLIPANYIPAISTMPGVRGVTGRLWGYYFDPSTGANYTVVVNDKDKRRSGTIAIGQGVARTLNVKKGDLIPFQSSQGTYVSFEIEEVFSSESELVSSDLIEMSAEDFRTLFGISKGYWTDLVLEVRNKNETVTVANKIKRSLPDTRPILRDEISGPIIPSLTGGEDSSYSSSRGLSLPLPSLPGTRQRV